MSAATPLHQVLPAAAIAQLQRAAQTPINRGDPLARAVAIEQAIQRIKREYPDYFKE
ncbi:hypothetical protein JK151_08990 [Ralstonia syzygii subsp. celebesensis]|uniref:Phage protein p39 n=1 Tax=blood disease bacterium R229 TaxID=741978 RepID=G2ZK26_9RALS|nr:hypothetical protein [Ralstonia syzygii]QQV54354.1 hypothetical protein JK151_08990 [Ralstonia syzygii subsp. celebesensis]CCA79389.1 phage protein p39 [blood disease bacterium R229]